MIVMTRGKDESVVINDSITIMVVEIKGDTVKLGIKAPPEVPINRGEIQKRREFAHLEASPKPTGSTCLVSLSAEQTRFLDSLADRVSQLGMPLEGSQSRRQAICQALLALAQEADRAGDLSLAELGKHLGRRSSAGASLPVKPR